MDIESTEQDGPTGAVQDIKCAYCGDWMVSREYICMGKRLWSMVHESCLQKVEEGQKSRLPYSDF